MTVQATFAATLVDEWLRAGVRHAVISPGSRSTPLALALAGASGLEVHVALDERTAGFLALGIGLATGAPAVALTTSGTAAVELHPAVVEASYAQVPLLACTADRPPELRDVAAPQAIDQTHLFGSAPRWFHDPGVPDAAAAPAWRALAARAVAESLGAGGRGAGPVHLNLPFREPLVADAGALPPGRPDGAPWTQRVITDHAAAVAIATGAKGIVVAGRGADPAIARATGWPVLADPLSRCRTPAPTTVAAFDALLRHAPFAEAHRPDVVLRLGAPPASRMLSEWVAGLDNARIIVVAPPGAWPDPEHRAHEIVPAIAIAGDGAPPAGWVESWAAADAAAQDAFERVLASRVGITEPGVARRLVAALPDGGQLVVSSSMPIRDVEWYGGPRNGLTVLANRGANGIDGVLSTGLGVALATGAPTAVLLGDLAFMHDQGGLIAAATRRTAIDLLIVLVDNDGGGIFSFLPQAAALPAERFEQLFGTPHGIELGAVPTAWRIPVHTSLDEAVGASGVRLLHAHTARTSNVDVHRELHVAVAAALDAL